MRRRDVLAFGGLAAVGLPTPVIAQGTRELRMVTDWAEGTGMLTSARRLAQTITAATDGRLRIVAYAADALVRPMEAVAAVQAGIADLYHVHEGFYETNSLAFHFFSGVPFGMTTDELFAWVQFGGGRELWNELSGQLGIRSLHASTTGPQMGGWFREEITSLESFRGLRYRMAEPGARVLREVGANAVALPGSQLASALQSGAIDAGEFVGPWEDMKIGLHQVAPYYYYPGWNEPSAVLTLGIAQRVWESIADSDKRIIEASAAAEYSLALAEANANNAVALGELRRSTDVELRQFDRETLLGLSAVAEDVISDLGAGDDLSRRIVESYRTFRSQIREWSEISVGAYLSMNSAE